MFVSVLGQARPGVVAADGSRWKSPVLQSLSLPTTHRFEKLVCRARKLLPSRVLDSAPRVRPTARPPRNMRSSAEGGPFVKEERLRLCRESVNKAEHIAQAKRTSFPTPANWVRKLCFLTENAMTRLS